jgi:cobalt/nickel transport system permease protein
VGASHSLDAVGIAGNSASPVHRLDPRAKLLGFAWITVVGVSTPLRAWPAYVGCALALTALARLAGVPPGIVWRRARVVLPLVLLVAAFIPFARGGPVVQLGPLTLSLAGLAAFAEVAAKATIGTVCAVLLGATTAFPDVLRALEALRIPRLLTVIAAFGYRYAWVLVEEVRRLRAALASRAYHPRHALHAAPLGRAATALFLRSYGRGERVYLAMLARGYDGGMPRLERLVLVRADVAFMAALVCALGALRLAAGLAA